MIRTNKVRGATAVVALMLGCVRAGFGQDLEPRRWSHLPVDVNFAGVGYAYTEADVFFDPVLELQDVTLDLQTAVAKYIRTFALLDRSARFEIAQPYQHAHWQGLLQGEPAERTLHGYADPLARFAVSLYGAPALKGPEFAAYRGAHPAETIVGAGLSVQAPLGQYHEEKLLNLGENRFALRPELGVQHSHGKWLGELTGSLAFFTVNDEFWNGKRREQDPMAIGQAHLAYTFRPGLWVSSGIGYGAGGESIINGTPKEDTKGNLAIGGSVGLPINPNTGVKLAYVNSRTQKDTGSDSDTVAAAVSVMW